MEKKYLTIFIIASLFAFFGLVKSSEAKNLYVNNSGTPACSDSTTYASNDAANPWCTIGRAAWGGAVRETPVSAQAAAAGDSVLVASGTYDISSDNRGRWGVLYNPANSGTSDSSRIIFEAVGTVTLTNSGVGPVIGADGRDYITWKGFTINEVGNTVASDTGTVVLHVTAGTIIENCIINGNVNSPLANNHNGVRIEASTDCIIRNNRISNVLNGCPSCYDANGACIMTYGSKNGIYEHNEFHNCGSAIFLKSGLPGGGYPDKNNNSIVRYNYLDNSGAGGSGINIGMIEGTSKVYQNLIKGFSSGTYVSSLTSQGLLGDVYLVNNTIVDPTSTSESATVTFNGRDSSTANFVIQNNITHKANNYIGVFATYWDDSSYLLFDYNDYYNVNSWRINRTNDTNLPAWRTRLGGSGAGNDNNSITENPTFILGTYKLYSGSPARTLGVDIIDLDNDGSIIDNIPAGAYISGNECIGLESGCNGDVTAPGAPEGFNVI